MEGNRVGVLLPGTPAQGAWKVADDVCAAFPLEIDPPQCKVYCYPVRPRHDRPAQHQAAGQTLALWRHDGEHRPAEPLEVLFCRGLPRWKRAMDIAAALFALALLSPLLALVAAAVKLTSPGPVLFAQWRQGLGGRRFLMYKFRSMRRDAEEHQAVLMSLNEQDGPAFKIRNDPRVTPLGRFLRHTSIDELPQLWNVLRGDMSLVGPRPLPCHEAEQCALWQHERCHVTPGLTCIWQVQGRSRVTFDDWMRMDVRYVRTRSAWADLCLLVQTIPAVLLCRGAH